MKRFFRTGGVFVLLFVLALLAQPVAGRYFMSGNNRNWMIARVCQDGAAFLAVDNTSVIPDALPSEITLGAFANQALSLIPDPGTGLLPSPPQNSLPQVTPFRSFPIPLKTQALKADLDASSSIDPFFELLYVHTVERMRWAQSQPAGSGPLMLAQHITESEYNGSLGGVEDCWLRQFEFSSFSTPQVLNSNRLRQSLPRPAGPQLDYWLELSPSLGALRRNTQVLIDRNSFTQAEVDSGSINYASSRAPGDTSGDYMLLSARDLALVSAPLNGEDANDTSTQVAVSASGRYIAFQSSASNLAGLPNLFTGNIYLLDRDLDGDQIYAEPGSIQLSLISNGISNMPANNWSFNPAFSGDERFIVYQSGANNLVADDLNEDIQDIFVYNRLSGLTKRVSLSTAGAESDGASYNPDISHSGRYIVFASDATNLTADGLNGITQILLRDRDLDNDGIFDEPGQVRTQLVSRNALGEPGDGASNEPVLSGDGRFVVFSSWAQNLVGEVVSNNGNIYLLDRDPDENGIFDEGAGSHITVISNGYNGPASNLSLSPAISADGSTVAFASDAINLIDPNIWVDSNGKTDIFLYDVVNPSLQLISHTPIFQSDGNSNDPSLSADGRRVVFSSQAKIFDGEDPTFTNDIYLYDRDVLGDGLFDEPADVEMARLSYPTSGYGEADDASFAPDISANGKFIAFESYASTLVSGDGNGFADVFVTYWAGRQMFPILYTTNLFLPVAHR